MANKQKCLDEDSVLKCLEFEDIPSDENCSEAGADSDFENEFGASFLESSQNEGEANPSIVLENRASDVTGVTVNGNTRTNNTKSPRDRQCWNSLNTILGEDFTDNESNYSDNKSTSTSSDNASEDDLTSEDGDGLNEDETGWGKDVEWYDNAAIPPFDEKLVVHFTDNMTKTEITPLHFFEKMFSKDLQDIIVKETNRYARQQGKLFWTQTNPEEFNAFIAILMIMGIHELPSISSYWSTNPLLHVECVAKVMSRNRFQAMLGALHCNDNDMCPEKSSPNYDKLHKLRPMITIVNKNCLTVVSPSSHQSIDESMIAFKGRNTMKQYMPLKPVKRGYKAWVRADSKSGYVCQFEIYTGKKENVQDIGLGERVVLDLAEAVSHSLCLLTFDNFFTSTRLVESLYANGIWSCGTVRTSRKDLPNMMKQNNKLERGQFKWRTKDNMSAIQWMDNKPVNFLTSAHNPLENRSVQRTKNDGSSMTIPCPSVVIDYNGNMGGVDKFDQLHQYYQIGRRSAKWWFRIFYWITDLCIVNAFIMYNETRKKYDMEELTQLEFRLRLIPMLIRSFNSRKRKGPVSCYHSSKKKEKVPEEVRKSGVGIHLPSALPNFRRCRLCSSKEKEKRTKIQCSACSVPLCTIPCFARFHTN